MQRISAVSFESSFHTFNFDMAPIGWARNGGRGKSNRQIAGIAGIHLWDLECHLVVGSKLSLSVRGMN